MSDVVASSVDRAGLLARGAGFFIDLALIAIVLQLIAFVAFPLTGGRVQAEGLVRFTQCQRLSWPPVGIAVALPAGFQPTTVLDCRVSLLGLEFARRLVVAQVERSGTWTRTTSIAVPIGRDGQLVSALVLDILLLPLLFASRIAGEALYGKTIGKRVVGAWVGDRSARAQASSQQILTRNVLLFLPLTPVIALQAANSLSAPAGMVTGAALWSALALAVLATLAVAAQLLVQRDTYYDRLADTAVFRRR